MDNEQQSAQGSELLAQAREKRGTLVGEFAAFLMANKKWWLAPILIAVLLLGALVLLGGTAAAPFVYTLF